MHDPTPSPARVLLVFLATFAIMFLVPLIPYGTLSVLTGLEPPGADAPGEFMSAVITMKVGVAFGFVALFLLARGALSGRWLTYAAVWWVMYVVVEIGQALGPHYSWVEAGAGIAAEAMYFPLSAWLADRLLGVRPPDAPSAV